MLKFSVLMPAYNEERNIQKAVMSIMSQTYKDFELIVVNDGSEDRTSFLLKTLKRRCQNLRVIDKAKNEGQMQTMKDASELARGEIICQFGGDMVASKAYLEKAARWFGNSRVVQVGGFEKPLNKGFLVSGAGFLDSLMQPKEVKYNIFMNGGGMCIRKPVLDRIGGYDESAIWSEDMSLNLRIKGYCKKNDAITARDPDMIYYAEYPPTPESMFKRHFLWGYGRANIIKKNRLITLSMFLRMMFIPAFIASLFLISTPFRLFAVAIIFFPILYLMEKIVQCMDIPEPMILMSAFIVAYIRIFGSSAGTLYGLFTRQKRLKTYD